MMCLRKRTFRRLEDDGGPTDLQTLSRQSVFPREKFKMAIAAFVILFSYISVFPTDKKNKLMVLVQNVTD